MRKRRQKEEGGVENEERDEEEDREAEMESEEIGDSLNPYKSFEATGEEKEKEKKRLDAFGDCSRLQDAHLDITVDEVFNVPQYTELLYTNYTTHFEDTEEFAHTQNYLTRMASKHGVPNKVFEDQVTIASATRVSSQDYFLNCLFNCTAFYLSDEMTSELVSLPEHLKVRIRENGAFYLGSAMLIPKRLTQNENS